MCMCHQDHRELREETEGWAEKQGAVVDFLLKKCRLNFTEDDVMWAIGGFVYSNLIFTHTSS